MLPFGGLCCKFLCQDPGQDCSFGRGKIGISHPSAVDRRAMAQGHPGPSATTGPAGARWLPAS